MISHELFYLFTWQNPTRISSNIVFYDLNLFVCSSTKFNTPFADGCFQNG